MYCKYIYVTKDYTKTCQLYTPIRQKCYLISAICFFLWRDQNFGIAFSICIGFLLKDHLG